MKRLRQFLSVLGVLITFTMTFVMMVSMFCGCEQQTEIKESVDSIGNIYSINGKEMLLPTQGVVDSLKNVTPYVINDIEDLEAPLKDAKIQFAKILAANKFECPFFAQTRASVENFVYKTDRPILLLDEDVIKGMYFKAKFGSAIVNAINAKVMDEYKISTGTTYCCMWDVYWGGVELQSNQKFGPVASPLCALHPDTRQGYTVRGYKTEKYEREDKSSYMHMYSFELVILYKDTSKKTIYLEIRYPKDIDEPHTGFYEFKYNVLTM